MSVLPSASDPNARERDPPEAGHGGVHVAIATQGKITIGKVDELVEVEKGIRKEVDRIEALVDDELWASAGPSRKPWCCSEGKRSVVQHPYAGELRDRVASAQYSTLILGRRARGSARAAVGSSGLVAAPARVPWPASVPQWPEVVDRFQNWHPAPARGHILAGIVVRRLGPA